MLFDASLESILDRIPRLTIAAYLKSLVPSRGAPEGLQLFAQGIPPIESLVSLLAIAALALAAAAWIFSSREYVLSQ